MVGRPSFFAELAAPAAVRLTAVANPQACLEAAALIGADTRGAGPGDAGDLLAAAVLVVLKPLGRPHGLKAAGSPEADGPALVEGVVSTPPDATGAPGVGKSAMGPMGIRRPPLSRT